MGLPLWKWDVGLPYTPSTVSVDEVIRGSPAPTSAGGLSQAGGGGSSH